MREIGQIIQVQVQIESLKHGQKPHRTYKLTNLRPVPAVKLSKSGVTGLEDDGMELLDVHHMAHPRSRYREGNGISFNFTSHYGRMRNRYGRHITTGCAGENIIIETARSFTLEQLANGLIIQTAAGQQIHLNQIAVMLPCLPFSRYSLQDANPSAELLKETLQFLDHGTRGFSGVLAGKTPASGQTETAVIRPGDIILLPAPAAPKVTIA